MIDMGEKMNSRILYIGPICSIDKYRELSVNYRITPSVAPMFFQDALLCGLKDNNALVDVIGLPIVPSFPNSKYFRIPFYEETLESGYDCHWIPTFNLPVLKQIERELKIKNYIRKWALKNKNTRKIVMVYSVFYPVFRAIKAVEKDLELDTISIVTDLPKYMFTYTQFHGIKKIIRNVYTKKIENIQGKLDKYVYLTEAMQPIVSPEKPYIVIEGIANCSTDNKLKRIEKKNGKFSIMYAGGLNKNYGIENLLKAVEKLPYQDIEMWLFGDGDAVLAIQEIQKIDKRIKYFGIVDHEVVLKKEREANLLVNVRNPKDEFTKYSFPSKTMEYMLSGTMLLTTRLDGIPDEYYDYVSTISDNSVDSIYKGIEQVYLLEEKERVDIGNRAQEFVICHKNAKIQARRILDFIEY